MCSTEQQVAKTFEVRQTSRMPFPAKQGEQRVIALGFTSFSSAENATFSVERHTYRGVKLGNFAQLIPANSLGIRGRSVFFVPSLSSRVSVN